MLEQVSEEVDYEEPKKKKVKKAMTPDAKYAHFLQKSVVRGKIVKINYFREQDLGLFLDKLEAQDWLKLFTNTHRGYFVPDLAEFYANCAVTQCVVTSTVNGHKLSFNAKGFDEILGVLAEGFGVYVREDKSVLRAERLLQLTQRLSQQPSLKAPRLVRKGEMTPIYHLLFYFVIKNVIPRGQAATLRMPWTCVILTSWIGGKN